MTDSFNWIGAIGAACSVTGAIFAWVKESKCSKNIRKDQYNRLISGIESDVESFLDFTIKFWSDSGLKSGDRAVLAHQIASKSKNISRQITSTQRKFPDFMGDNTELIQEFISLSDKASGDGFQSKGFKTDDNKVNLMIAESVSIRKILDLKLKV